MNFRITTLFFALLLTMLWVFGLMVAHKKAAGDPGLVVPKLASKDAKDIAKVHVKRADDKIDAEFDLIGERWYLQGEGGQKVKVQGYHIDEEIIKQIKAAKNDDTADVSRDLAHYGLANPKMTVTLTGKYKGEDHEWKFYVGNESGGLVYVNSSDRPDKVFAIPKKQVERLYFKDPNYLRDKRLFDFVDTAVTTILAKKGDKELELKRGEGSRWTFVRPKLGIADFGSEPEEPKDPHKKDFMPKPPVGGVKGLLKNIAEVRVDAEADFVPLGKAPANFGVEKGKEKMLVQITFPQDKKDTSEILYIGNTETVDKTVYYFARLDSDDGIMKIKAQYIEPLIKAIEKPEELRSKDIASFVAKQVDAVTIKQDKTEVQFFKSGEKAESKMPFAKFQAPEEEATWEMVIGSEKQKASDAAIMTLIETVRGQKGIVAFHDGTEAELKKKEVEWGLDNPAAKILIYIDGIDKSKKEEKKEEKKDDKKEAKKDEPKKESLPTLKKIEPEIMLAIGNLVKDKDEVNVRRTLKDGTVTYFTMKKDIRERALPPEGIELAYLDTSAPPISVPDIVSLRLLRATDKGQETIELEHRDVDGKSTWFIKDKTEPAGYKLSLADQRKADELVSELAGLRVRKWLKKLDEATDADKFGPKGSPVVQATITVHKQTANYAAGVIGAFALPQSLVTTISGAILQRSAEKFDDAKPLLDTITIEFGKETDVEKDKPGAYAKHSGSKLLFLVHPPVITDIKKLDLRDRSFVLYTQPELDVFNVGAVAANPLSALMLDSPLVNGIIHRLDPEKVKEVRLAVRTPAELRKFAFERKEKEKAKEPEKAKEKEKAKDDKTKDDKAKDDKAKDDKVKDDKGKDKNKDAEKVEEKVSKWTWIDKSTGLDEFTLDPDKVAGLVKEFAKLQTGRFVTIAGGPRPEQKLTDKEATVKLELVMEDNSVVTVLVGTTYVQHGYFATSSVWVGSDGKASAVFFLSRMTIDPLLRGADFFAKERSN